MTLQQATEIMTQVKANPCSAIRTDFPPAAQIAIAALKRLDDWRRGKVLNPDLLLPTETED